MAVMNKLKSLHDAIAADVQDGTSIAMGCALESLIPFAASYEIIRQKRKDLTLIAPISDIQFDQLIGAGCVAEVQSSAGSLDEAGLAPCFTRAVKAGSIRMRDATCPAMHSMLEAAAKGIPFIPIRGVAVTFSSTDRTGR